MTSQSELPGFALQLRLFADETLFSWCSRYHRMTANGRDAATCLQLFGDRRIGSAHDFPARLDALVERSGGTIGDARSLVREHTILPFYLPFRSLQLAEESEAAMRGNNIGGLKYRLGLQTSGLGSAHPLKACQRCMDADHYQHGWAYWHREHQLPGAWVCNRHQTSLLVSPSKLNQRVRFSWVLPSASNLTLPPGRPQDIASQPNDHWPGKMASLAAELLRLECGALADPVRLASALRHRLFELDLASASGRVKWRDAEASLKLLATRQLRLPEMQHLADFELLKAQLLRALAGRSVTHPLRWMLWSSAWFNDLQHLKMAYDHVDSRRTEVHPFVAPEPASHGPKSWQLAVLAQSCKGVISMTKGARIAGVAYNTFAAWACARGIEAAHRPKKVDSNLRQRIVNQLQAGQDMVSLAGESQLSIETLTRILRTTPGLREMRNESRFELRRKAARKEWHDVLTRDPLINLKMARSMAPATYAWLYRHDREWLQSLTHLLQPCVVKNNAQRRVTNAIERQSRALQQLLDLYTG